MPQGDPIANAVSEALDAVQPITNTTANAANEAGNGENGGSDDNNAASQDDKGNAGADAGNAGADNGAGAGSEENGAAGTDGGAQLDLTEVIAKDVTALDDAEKAFIVENQDDLTGKQVKAYKEAGIDFGDTTATGASADELTPAEQVAQAAPKPHDVPADDTDLAVEIEDAEGNKFTINNVNDIPEDFIFKDSRQPIAIAEQLRDAAAERTRRAALREENTVIEQSNTIKTQTVNLWKTELAELQAAGIIPAGDADFEKGKFANKEVEDGVNGLFNDMIKYNSERAAKGLPLLSSLHDVQVYRERDAAKAAEAAAAAKDKTVKTEKAKVVAGSTTSTDAAAGKDEPTYVRGSGVGVGDIVEDAIKNLGN